MRDLTFVIPVRIDTDDRLGNLEIVLKYLARHFPAAEVIVSENGPEPRAETVRRSHPGAIFRFERNEGRFSKSSATNAGILAATRRFTAIYDADVLLAPRALRVGVRLLKTGLTRVVLPFNWIFVDVRGDAARLVSANLDVGDAGGVRRLTRPPTISGSSVRAVKGGVVLADSRVLRLEGGLNRKMISYGWEDIEIVKRLDKLGYRSISLPAFSLVHLEHARGPDSRGNEHYARNEAEFRKVAAMSRRELQSYVETDLDIAAPGAAQDRAALRRRQRTINALTIPGLTYRVNQAVVGIQVYGARQLLHHVRGGRRT